MRIVTFIFLSLATSCNIFLDLTKISLKLSKSIINMSFALIVPSLLNQWNVLLLS